MIFRSFAKGEMLMRGQRLTSQIFQSLLFAVLLTPLGCGGGNIPLTPVKGTVSMDGSPVPQATIEFRSHEGRPAMAVTDDDGNYEMMYTRERKGAVDGEYTVVITTAIEADADSSNPLEQQGREETLPKKYNKESTLKVTVDRKRTEPYDFALTSQD